MRRDAVGYYWITGRVDDVINVSGHRCARRGGARGRSGRAGAAAFPLSGGAAAAARAWLRRAPPSLAFGRGARARSPTPASAHALPHHPRIGTAEVESALVAHPKCAEAAVVGYEHPIKGQGIYAFVTLMEVRACE